MKMCLQLCWSCSLLMMITATILSTAQDTTTDTFQSIADGQTVVSTGGAFELGFFSLGDKRYVGIWYKMITDTTYVWVANRDTPLIDSSGVLKVTNPGILVLANNNMTTVWSSNTSRSAQNPVARLLDSGNLVVIDGIGNANNEENFLWQSFDYPGDTLLPGMKLSRNTRTGLKRVLSSWTSPQDPSPGNYTYEIAPNAYAEEILMKDSVIIYRTGPWIGMRFSGVPRINANPIYKSSFVFDNDEIYYNFELINNSIISRLMLTADGLVRRYNTWIDKRTQGWNIYLTVQVDSCDNYAVCGPYGICSIEKSPICNCLKGFKPKFPDDWALVEWSGGCKRRTPLNCSTDAFQKFPGVKLPYTEHSWFNRSMNLKECGTMCKNNCTCTAYSNLDFRDEGSGCLLWFGDLIDIRSYTEKGQDIYIRLAASDIDNTNTQITAESSKSSKSNVKKMVQIAALSTGLLILGLMLVFFIWKKQRKNYGKLMKRHSQKEDLELPWFELATVVKATNNFSDQNKLGEGGFGHVFKGTLNDGKEIAVKRLSKTSTQGLNELMNEVTHIAKLQHRNLVSLLGCCIQEEEMMLIYEFMPNKSLDFFIFEERKGVLLDWPKRFDIISGIARGLLYLHQDSRLRVIHRDLKAGNILLGSDFEPKISDFGLARSFGGNQTKAETNTVVGTYGYMSPEYAIDGFYSIKSDVYSFGVLVLEILSGKRNRGFSHPGHHLNLLGHAWTLHLEGRSIELLDRSVGDSSKSHEVVRSIHVGLLCVQRNPADRPSMSEAVHMMGGDGALPQPQKPGFYSERDLIEGQPDPSYTVFSVSDDNFTLVEPR